MIYVNVIMITTYGSCEAIGTVRHTSIIFAPLASRFVDSLRMTHVSVAWPASLV
jgi:hypothetical protein